MLLPKFHYCISIFFSREFQQQGPLRSPLLRAHVGPKANPSLGRSPLLRAQEAFLEGPGRIQAGYFRHLEPRGPPGGPRGAKMTSRWLQNDLKVTPAWVQNQSKTDIKCLRLQRSDTLKLGFSSESLGFSSEHLGFGSEKLGFSSGLQL